MGHQQQKKHVSFDFAKLALYQEPYACVLSCSDSRVVPEIIFDCGIGELFVV